MRNKIIRSVSTVFGIGYLPLMPGTFASLAGLLLYLVIRHNIHLYLGITIFLLIAGLYVSGKAEKLFGKDDPGEIVIDELCGMLIVYLFIPFTLFNLITGFIIFRVLDIIKLYPISRLERLKGGWGIMLDDITAGIFANIMLQVANYVIYCKP